MTLEAGTSIGPYLILGSLGAGGMGEVYRARDTRLDRVVAIKILPDSFATDAERVARFEREAKTLAALNHPNVAQIYGLEEFGGRRALAMEFVEGENLAQRLQRGAVPLDEALAIARQIAEGLDAAHELSIVHRDLKPSNIQLREDGTAKILDFGLAKALAPASSTPDLISSPTITSPAATQRGVVLGTAAYMAPEQAKGRIVDKRADIWAFGAVVYEMVIGRRAFEGNDVSELLASVLKLEPDWSRVPPRLQRLLRSCLEKDPKKRLRDIADWSRLIDDATAQEDSRESRRPWLPWFAAATALVAAASLAFVHFRERPIERTPLRFQIAAPPGNVFETVMTLSPDGRRVAFNARDSSGVVRLWVRDLDALESRAVAGTDGGRSAFWSPDGRSLAFVVGRQLKKIDVAGGGAMTLYEASSPGELGSGNWSATGGILIGGINIGSMRRISVAGGTVTQLTTVDTARSEQAHGLGEFLPGGRSFLYFRVSRDPNVNGVYVGTVDRDPANQSLTRLIASDQRAVYSGSAGGGGRLLFQQKGTLMAQPFDADRHVLTGEPVPVVDEVGNLGAQGFFGVSGDVLAYRVGRIAGGGRLSQIAWLNRQGAVTGKVGEPGTYTSLELSSDGTSAVLADATIVELDLWTLELARGISTRFVSNPAVDTSPVWSPDRKRVAFASNRGGNFDLFVKTLGGSAEELLVKSDSGKYPTHWSKDGRFVMYTERRQGVGDVMMVPVQGDRTPVPLVHSDFEESQAHFSPDMRWIIYTSNESGREEVYLRPFDPAAPASTGHATRLSKDGGTNAHWRQDGKEVIFAGLNGAVMSVAIGPTLDLPTTLFTLSPGSNWDVSGDGNRFLVALPEESGLAPINVLVNWKPR